MIFDARHPYGPNWSELAIFTALCGVMVLASVAGISCRAAPQAAPVADATPVAPPPPCVRENCAERAAWLNCVEPGVHLCDRYAIAYERHCDCIEWASPSQDGGAR